MPIASIARRLIGSARRSGSGRPAGAAGGGSTDARIGRGVRTVLRRFTR